MSGWTRKKRNQHEGRTPLRRDRHLRFERCEDRRLLSAASSADSDWIAPILPALAALLPSDAWRDLNSASLAVRDQFTFSSREGPEHSSVDPEFGQMLDEAVQQAGTELDFSWALESREVEDTGVLPPTPWFDDEFRETLNELLLPEGPRYGTQWSLQLKTSLIGDGDLNASSTSRWESASLIDFGLTFQTTARFQAWLVSAIFPQDTIASASNTTGLLNRPVIVQALSVDVLWSDVYDFWNYPIAGDLMSLVAGSDATIWLDGPLERDRLTHEPIGNATRTGGLQLASSVFASGLGGPIGSSVHERQTPLPSDSMIESSATSEASVMDQSGFGIRQATSMNGSESLDGWQDGGFARVGAGEIIEFEPQRFGFLVKGSRASDRLDSTASRDDDSWRRFSSVASDTLETQGTSLQEAANSEYGSVLAAEATRIGLRRWLPSERLVDATHLDVVDVAILAQEPFYKTASHTAVLAQSATPPADSTALDEPVSLRGSRGRCQAFDLVYADEDFSGPMGESWSPQLNAAGGLKPPAPDARPTADAKQRLPARSRGPAYATLCRSGWMIVSLAAYAIVDAARRSLHIDEEDRKTPHEHGWPPSVAQTRKLFFGRP